MAQIAFVGDPHGDFSFVDGLAAEPPDAVVLLGDLELPAPLEQVLAPLLDRDIEIWFIPGNHDVDKAEFHDRLFESRLADRNLHARVADVAGVRVAGLGGTFDGAVWDPRRPRGPRYPPRAAFADAGERLLERDRFEARLMELPGAATKERKRLEGDLAAIESEISTLHGDDALRDRGHSPWRGGLPLAFRAMIFYSDIVDLQKQRADVLVSHEAASCCRVPRFGGGEDYRLGFECLDKLAAAMGAQLIVSGHHHLDYHGEVAGGVQVRGVGQAKVWRTMIAPGDRR